MVPLKRILRTNWSLRTKDLNIYAYDRKIEQILHAVNYCRALAVCHCSAVRREDGVRFGDCFVAAAA